MDKTALLTPNSDWQKWEFAVLAELAGDKKVDLWEAAIDPGEGDPNQGLDQGSREVTVDGR